MKKLLGIQADIWGIAASFTCALHCSVLPLLLAMGSLSAFTWMQNEWVEFGFLATAVILSLWSILPTYLKDRNQALLLWSMVVGLLFLMIGFLTHQHNGEVNIFSVIGGFSLCFSHLFNFKLQNHNASLSV